MQKSLAIEKKRRLRDPLDTAEQVLILTERLKKKVPQAGFMKAQQKVNRTLTEAEFSP